MERVPVEPLARMVERRQVEQGLTLSEICRNLGWYSSVGRPDTNRLQRRLGRISHSTVKRGKLYAGYQKTIGYELATQIAKAAGVDPVDVGL
jgi:hypothetical protein